MSCPVVPLDPTLAGKAFEERCVSHRLAVETDVIDTPLHLRPLGNIIDSVDESGADLVIHERLSDMIDQSVELLANIVGGRRVPVNNRAEYHDG